MTSPDPHGEVSTRAVAPELLDQPVRAGHFLVRSRFELPDYLLNTNDIRVLGPEGVIVGLVRDASGALVAEALTEHADERLLSSLQAARGISSADGFTQDVREFALAIGAQHRGATAAAVAAIRWLTYRRGGHHALGPRLGCDWSVQARGWDSFVAIGGDPDSSWPRAHGLCDTIGFSLLGSSSRPSYRQTVSPETTSRRATTC